LYRLAFAAILAIAISVRAATPDLGQLDASPTLFTVMAALNAAGYDADLASGNNHPLRNAIRAELAKRNIPSLPAIKDFLAKHRRRSDGDVELSPYLSFALTAGGPPNFAITTRDIEIPPDVSSLKEFSQLLAAFYKEANIEDLWKRSQSSIDRYCGIYHGPVSEAVLQVNSFLRQPTSGVRGSHFQVLIELLAAPNQIQTRSYGTDYTVVITPSPEPRTFDVRHAYLHYSLEPLATRYHEILERKKVLADHAIRARGLGDSFKEDFLLLTTESLIKAIEARLDHKPEGVQEALREGYILAPYFAEQLPVYEKQEQSMALYYSQMVGAIDLVKEDARLSKVEFTAPAARPTVKTPTPPPVPALTGAAKTLEEAEQLYKANDLDRANKLFTDLLQQSDLKSMRAAAYYGMARIATKKRDPDNAERLFQRTLEMDPEPFVKAWTLVYLGRLSMTTQDGGPQAANYFQQALAVEGGSDEARKAAQQALQQILKQ
jgi:tetratricopeptide (TPR) repeat protein